MNDEQLNAWYENIARVEEIIRPVDCRINAVLDLCSVLELANIEIRFED